jgi:hypothetical protein
VKDAMPALLFGQDDGAFRPDSPWLWDCRAIGGAVVDRV